MTKTFYSLYLKRFIDFNLSLLALILLSPLLILIIILQFFFNGPPIFFTQARVGRGEKVFKLIKFRTMNNKKDKSGVLLPDIKRKTFFGSFLRKTSLDELPNLINILKGDMAVIGPRPLLVEYLSFYNEYQKQRHLVRPGLSGLAQIKGRNLISWNQKFDYDILYIKRITMIFDIKIILSTIVNVFLLKPVNSSKNNTIEKFNGN
jgi:lipopolysaccharide/colanic/teichoic acid biosynthesis glycosyltransferase